MKNGFLNEIKKCLLITDFFSVQIFTFGALIQDVKKIDEYSTTKILLTANDKKQVEIVGEGLKITKLCDGDLTVLGRVDFVGVKR